MTIADSQEILPAVILALAVAWGARQLIRFVRDRY